ncbi:MAG TPA: glutamine--fructose-6-phosphate transaminase (isomerizing) [Phycisphaerae bacterium]|nr:glutamine--fructose-6-phosphate transaminase (isomerizing) [Phycisphaerae bacterium]HRY70138.1 glutamine--fructose-6-phosphate transaminase (isomerizing) [Phycisphaerae bacterium]HSA28278.1 glutamine--fructose-6-phosphate transaminase (isomerizing) [Phycisphaerae bacterium]
MCGIVGYIGHQRALPILIEGLKRLEYRGYDSSGVAMLQDGKIDITRAVGRISNLEARLGLGGIETDCRQNVSTTGIAHTRWATHGGPTEKNAHPHLSWDGRVAVVHNGIIENYRALATFLERHGIRCVSETDTEVLAHLIGHCYRGNLEQAVRDALHEVQGTYGIAVVCANEPGTIVAARKGSPLIIGVGNGEYLVASDASAIVKHTTQVVYLSDGEMATVTSSGFHTTTLDAVPVTKDLHEVEFSLEEIELAGHEHFMAKEIFEQSHSLATTLRGRLDTREGQIILGGIANHARDLARAKRIIFTAQGTAWHAGIVGEYMFEDIAKIPAEVEYASEFRYRNPLVDFGTVVIAISQSGETADTLAAVREAKVKGALCLGVVNAVGSTIARESDAGVYLHCGPEIGVASTKAFTSQIAVLAMMAIQLGRRRFLSQEDAHRLVNALDRIPDQVAQVVEQSDAIRAAVESVVDRENWLFLGRGYNYPIALEGALKLKEISYIHAEGMPAAEMKHGPIALINEGMPVVFIATRGHQYDKVLSNIEEVRSRGGRIIAVATQGDAEITAKAEHVFYVPNVPEPLQPLLTVVPLQLLAYHAAVLRGCNVDKPRNLAKSVTVE